MKNEKLSWADVPFTFHPCVHAQCPLAAQCLRATAYALLPETETQVTIVNPKACSQTEDCRFFVSNAPVVYARGFAQLKGKITPAVSAQVREELMNKWGRRGYYRRRSGEILLPIAEQKMVRNALSNTCVAIDSPFDGYEEHLAWH